MGLDQTLAASLAEQGIAWITSLKKNIKAVARDTFDILMLRKRSIIKTINDPLKNILPVEHTRHRSLANYRINIIAGLVAYSYQDKKTSAESLFRTQVTNNNGGTNSD